MSGASVPLLGDLRPHTGGVLPWGPLGTESVLWLLPLF
jgi:hypothetical protein